MQNERSDDLLAVALLYYVRDDKYSPIYTQNYINKTAAIPGVQKKKNQNSPLDNYLSILLTIHQPSPPTAATINHHIHPLPKKRTTT